MGSNQLPQNPYIPGQLSATDKLAVGLYPVLQTLQNGMASYQSDYFRSDQTAKLLVNVLQSRKQNIWTNRDCGMVRRVSSALDASDVVLELGSYYDASGVKHMLAQTGTGVYNFNTATNVATALTGTSAATVPFCIRPFQPSLAGTSPVAILTSPQTQPQALLSPYTALAFSGLNGNSTTTLWGSTASPLAAKSYSNPGLCTPFLNRMAYAQFTTVAGNSSQAGNQFDIVITNAGAYNTCTQNTTVLDTDGVIFQVPAICGTPTAMFTVQLNNQNNSQALVIGCTDGVCVITGTGTLEFGLFILTQEFGIPSNRAVIQVLNDAIFIADDGIRSFASLALNSNLVPSTLSYGIQDNVQTWDQAYLKYAFVVRNRTTKDIQFWVPVVSQSGASSNGVCSLGIVMNYGASTAGATISTQLTYQFSYRQGINIPCAIEFRDASNNNTWTMFSGGYNGIIYQHYQGNLSDSVNGSPLPVAITFALVDTPSPQTRATMQRILILCEGAQQSFFAGMSSIERQNDGTFRKQQMQQSLIPIVSGGSQQTILSEWILSLSAFPGTYVQPCEFLPTIEGHGFELQLTTNASNNYIDCIGAHYLMKLGGLKA